MESRGPGIDELKSAFAYECQSHLLFMRLAAKAEAAGQSSIARSLRRKAAADARRADMLLDFIEIGGDPVLSDLASNPTALRRVIRAQTLSAFRKFAGLARRSRSTGEATMARWFDAVAKQEASDAAWFEAEFEETQ